MCDLDSRVVTSNKIGELKNIIAKKSSTGQPIFTFVLFHSPTCGHCIDYKPLLDKYRSTCRAKSADNIQIVMINSKTSPELSKTPGLIPGVNSISGYPMTFVFENGRLIGTIEGNDPKALEKYMRQAGL